MPYVFYDTETTGTEKAFDPADSLSDMRKAMSGEDIAGSYVEHFKTLLTAGYIAGPWYGAIRTAKVFCLYLNPGLDPVRDPSLYRDREFASLMRRRLEQMQCVLPIQARNCRTRFFERDRRAWEDY